MLIISVLGDNFRRLRRRGIVLLTLANTFLKRFSFAVLKFIKTSVPFLKKGLIIIIINDSQKSICRFLWFIIEITFLNWDLNWYSFFIGNSNHFKKNHHVTLLQNYLHHELLKKIMYHQKKVLYWKTSYLIYVNYK